MSHNSLCYLLSPVCHKEFIFLPVRARGSEAQSTMDVERQVRMLIVDDEFVVRAVRHEITHVLSELTTFVSSPL